MKLASLFEAFQARTESFLSIEQALKKYPDLDDILGNSFYQCDVPAYGPILIAELKTINPFEHEPVYLMLTARTTIRPQPHNVNVIRVWKPSLKPLQGRRVETSYGPGSSSDFQDSEDGYEKAVELFKEFKEHLESMLQAKPQAKWQRK